MDLNLIKFFYTQLDSVPHGGLKIFISKKAERNHRKKCRSIRNLKPESDHLVNNLLTFAIVAIGDSQGQVNIFLKSPTAMTLKAKTEPSRKSISRLQIIYSIANAKPSLMYAAGNKIHALTTAGKEYFSFESNVTEPIKWIFKEGKGSVFSCGEYILNFYYIGNEDVEDLFQFNSPAEVMDVFVHCLDGTNFYPILTCKDRAVRVLNTEGIVYQFSLTGIGECLVPYCDVNFPFNDKANLTKHMVFGQSDGLVVCFEMTVSHQMKKWTLHPKHSKAGVVCINFFKMTERKKEDMIVARTDTTIEVYMNMAPPSGEIPVFEMRGTIEIGESITNIYCANFGPEARAEILTTTYSGKVYSVFNEEVLDELPTTQQNKKEKVKEAKKLNALENDIRELEMKVDQEYDVQMNQDDGFSVQISNEIDWKMEQVSGAGNRFEIRVDSQFPFESVVIDRSKGTQFEYQDQPGIVIETPGEFSDEREFVAIDFSSCETNRMSFYVEPSEGISCDLNIFVTPNVPQKFGQLITVPIKPLCSHHPIESIPGGVVMNTMTITGKFSPSQINNWLYRILPDISALTEENDIELRYQSSTSKAYLQISLEIDKAEIRSQSVSTLSIIKQCISRFAADQNKYLSIKTKVNDHTVGYILNQMEVVFGNSKTLALQLKVIDALREIQNQEGGLEMLSQDKKNLLFNADKIVKRNASIPKELEMYKSIIASLYRDYRLLKGHTSTPNMQTLKEYLKNFDKENILKLILS